MKLSLIIIRKHSLLYTVDTIVNNYTVHKFILLSLFFLSFFLVRSIGCFKDTGRRAIPQMDGRGILVRGYYRRRADAIFKCALEAMKRSYRYFAVQHQGWCATGPRAHVTYRRYGRSNRCRNGKGGPWANDVYSITGRC